MSESESFHFFSKPAGSVIKALGKERWMQVLKKMILIRHFEIRAEAAYQQGKIGGFFHSYIGQEAIQTAAVEALGVHDWYTTTYRCHALALLLGVTPKEAMAELYGKETGNAKGRGGSMHLFSENLLGGFGIVGGHIPIATGAAFSIKYQNQKEKISLCFLGEGGVAQGSFHESLNLASLWDLPILYIIENNKWGMGTPVSKAISIKPIAEKLAPTYGMKGYTLDGSDFFSCFSFFEEQKKQMLRLSRPVLVEAMVERFKGHSVSDPGLYRTKEELEKAKEKDPILYLKEHLFKEKLLSEEAFKKIEEEQKQQVIQAMEFAEKSPLPNPITLEEGVLAP